MSVLLTAATGMFGKPLALRLDGEPVKALVRRHRADLPDHVEQVQGDFDDAGSLSDVMNGVEKLYLSCPSGPQMVERQIAVVGHHPVAEVDARDVAAVAETVLRADRLPERLCLELTGPRALTYHQIAEILTRATGRVSAISTSPPKSLPGWTFRSS